MLPDELTAYLAGAGLGLVVGTNLFALPFPDSAQDQAVCIVEDPGERSEGTFGDSLSAPAIEHPHFRVLVRDGRENGLQARTKARDVYKKLRRLGPVALSGVNYLNVEADPPAFLSFDQQHRPRYVIACRATKEES